MKTKKEHLDYILKWQKENRDKCNARAKKYYYLHREEILTKNKLTGKNTIKRHYDPIKHKGYVQKYELKIKTKVFTHYCNGDIKCKCCKLKIMDFLTIDHVDGRKKWNHGKELGGKVLYHWLIKNNMPLGFDVVCFNCNWGRYINNGICPHELIA